MLKFLTQSITRFRHTGAIWPSGDALAREMTRTFREHDGPRRILEVGPGTGAFTRHILKELREHDEFDIVEINPVFCRHLESNLLEPYRRRTAPAAVGLHHAAIEDADLAGTYDHIVCGLPFNNFPPSLVRSIFRRMIELLDSDGDLSYFEYAAVRAMKAPVAGRSMRHKMRRLDAHAKSLARRHAGRRTLVMANIPPAVAVRLHGLAEADERIPACRE